MRCLIVDDEPLAIKVIENHLKEFGGFEVVGKSRSALQAFNILEKTEVDLLFLDIEMPKLDGLSFLKALNNPPLVILTTAHRDFALEGYNMDVVDYLLKPIALERFMQAISKAQRIFDASESKPGKSDVPNNKSTNRHIYIKENRENVRVELNAILYIESIKNHIKIVTEKRTYLTMVSIGDMETKVPSAIFIRIHRSFIVNLNAIQNYTNSYIVINKKSFPIGNNYKEKVLKNLDKNRI